MAYRHFNGEVGPERDPRLRPEVKSISNSGKNPRMRSLTDDEFSQKIHDKFSQKIYAELHLRPHKMAALKEKSISNSGKNPHMRSLTVDEFSQKIHAELHVRPHKMAALKVSGGSTGSHDRNMSKMRPHDEALELQVSPHKLATALTVSGGSTGSPDKAKLQISPDNQAATGPYIYRNMGQKPAKYAYAFKQVNLKRGKKTSQVEIYLNNSRSRRIYTRAIIVS